MEKKLTKKEENFNEVLYDIILKVKGELSELRKENERLEIESTKIFNSNNGNEKLKVVGKSGYKYSSSFKNIKIKEDEYTYLLNLIKK